MARIEAKLAALGLVLPPQLVPPGGAALPFRFVHLRGNRALISGHGPLAADGTVEEGTAPRLLDRGGVERWNRERTSDHRALTGLAILGSLQRALGDLDRITAWGRIFGMVNSAPGFDRQPAVINGFSDLILELFGPEVGAHARSAVGMAELPFGIPVEIEGEVEFRS